jgi:1,4-dihydroxy-2-naphthoate octaprenyltransferase
MSVDNAVTLVRSMRPAFLLLTPVCILLGVATAFRSAPSLVIVDVVLVLVGALLAHISVNLLNEYHDFRSGLDARTIRTAFSGGSGALVERPGAANLVRNAGIVALLLAAAIGVYFLTTQGLSLLPIGILGLLVIISYTPWINRHPVLCLLAPGLGFGPLMVLGTHVALTGEYSVTAFVVSLVPFFLVNNLLLFNQYPDIEADRSVGRRHFPIAYGIRTSNIVYALFMLASCATIMAGIWLGYLPGLAIIALLPVLAAALALAGMIIDGGVGRRVPVYLGLNVAATLLIPGLLSAGMMLSNY